MKNAPVFNMTIHVWAKETSCHGNSCQSIILYVQSYEHSNCIHSNFVHFPKCLLYHYLFIAKIFPIRDFSSTTLSQSSYKSEESKLPCIFLRKSFLMKKTQENYNDQCRLNIVECIWENFCLKIVYSSNSQLLCHNPLSVTCPAYQE